MNGEDINENLRKFQLFILKARNSECLINKYGDLKHLDYELELGKLNEEAEKKNWTQFKYLNQTKVQTYNKDMVEKFTQLVNKIQTYFVNMVKF